MAVRRRLLTIYNCGTSSNRDKGTALEPGKAGELIAYLYDKTADPDITSIGRPGLDQEYRYKLIHDGPGSAPKPFGKWETNAQGVRQFVQHPASDSRAGAPSGTGLLARARGMLTGAGWEANVAHAVQTVKSLKYKPDAINLAGWSRGGITCHMIANALYKDEDHSLSRIPVNIFAVDPVPGGRFGKHGSDQLDISGNIAQYRGVFAVDDRKLGFRPAVVTKKDRKDDDILFYPMPGVHDTVVQGAPGLSAVALLVEDLASEFLELNGTTFSKRLHLEPQEICEYYAIAKKTRGEYRALAGKGGLNKAAGLFGYAPAGTRANLPGGVELDPSSIIDLRQEYFVNRHHEQAFGEAFPHVYSLLFTPRQIDHALTRYDQQAIRELNKMKIQQRNSYQQLVTALGG